MIVAGIVSDSDGLIADIESYHEIAWGQTLEYYGHSGFTHEEYKTLAGKSGEVIADILCESRGIAVDRNEFREVRWGIYCELREERGIPIIERNVRLLKALSALFPGVPLAIASSSALEHVTENVKQASLQNLVRGIATPDQVKGMKSKPAPDVCFFAADLIGVDPSQCIYLDDTSSGCMAGKAAGMFTMALPHEITMKQDFSMADVVLMPDIVNDTERAIALMGISSTHR